MKRERIDLSFLVEDKSRFSKETRVDRTRRHCSVETIRGTGPSELGWSWPMSKNPLERAWPQWDQRRLSNRREQILHFDLSRKGREAITLHNKHHLYTYILSWHIRCETKERQKLYVREQKRCGAPHSYETNCLLQLYQEVNDLLRSISCCDDENERIGGDTSLPEQHFYFKMMICIISREGRWKVTKNFIFVLQFRKDVSFFWSIVMWILLREIDISTNLSRLHHCNM